MHKSVIFMFIHHVGFCFVQSQSFHINNGSFSRFYVNYSAIVIKYARIVIHLMRMLRMHEKAESE